MCESLKVLDVVLPGLNGCDLQKVAADRADMPIIFMTGCRDVPTTVRAMKAGAAARSSSRSSPTACGRCPATGPQGKTRKLVAWTPC